MSGDKPRHENPLLIAGQHKFTGLNLWRRNECLAKRTRVGRGAMRRQSAPRDVRADRLGQLVLGGYLTHSGRDDTP